MKFTSSNTKRVYELDITSKRTICPECSQNRRKSKEQCVHWDNNRGYCHHCNTSFFEYEHREKITYTVPEWKNITQLTDKAVQYFTGRGISQGTLNRMKVYSDREFMPQFSKEVDVICFPYFLAEKLVNIKYRGPQKTFKMVAGAELIFWNHDVVKDEVVIVEGEFDLLSYIEAGIDNVISVPNGANKNLEYLDNYFERFEAVKTIYLAVDNDTKGIELRDELARRLGAQRCMIVNFKDCKDANAYLQKYGALELHETIKQAIAYPIKGIVKVNDLYGDLVNLFENGIQKGKIIRSDIDSLITWETGRLCMVTGIPGHGKSEFVDFIISKLNLLYGWKIALFTPENYPLKFHYAKIYEKFTGRKFSKIKSTDHDFQIAYEHIRDGFFYLMDDEDFSIDTILDGAKSLIKSKGIKVLVVDPYNKLEYQAGKGESETQYVSRVLDKLLMFARLNDCLVILVAHPRKMQKNNGVFDVPTLYDISGSAHFYNKTDYGICVYRKKDSANESYINQVEVHVQKVKFKHLGECGMKELRYNYNNGRFENEDLTIDHWDNSNWLINGPVETAESIELSITKNESPF